MGYEIRYRDIEIPELDAFLKGYAELCEKHGMMLETGEYDRDGGHYVTITTWDGGQPCLNLSYASGPCFDRANAEAEKLRRNEEAARVEAERSAIEKTEPGDPETLLAEALKYMAADTGSGAAALRLKIIATVMKTNAKGT